MPELYVAILDLPTGERLFCTDRFRDEWSGRFGLAETFQALHEALGVAEPHGGRALRWVEAQAFETSA